MILNPFSYTAPETLQEAISLLTVKGSEVFTGDQAHIGNAKRGVSNSSALVSLRKIPELKFISKDAETLKLGSAVTFGALLANNAVNSFPVLVDALKASGDPHVRNHSTIGGALYLNTLGHGPVLAALTVLNAEVVILTSASSRQIPIDVFFAEGGSAGLTGGEIVTGIVVPVSGSALGSFHFVDYLKSGRVACGIALSFKKENNVLSDIRIAVSGCVPVVTRLSGVEASLSGKEISVENIDNALKTLTSDALLFSSSFISNPSYLLHLTKVLIKRAVLKS
jgi:CO/xanthine dehydrogenase FAD-binding subunit